MANTYVVIATTTVGSGGTSSIDFTSIPATYTDLLIKLSARTNLASSAYEQLGIQLNGSTASNYQAKLLYGIPTTVGSANSGTVNAMAYAGYATASTATANTFGNIEIYIPNYAGSTAKSVSIDGVSENNATDAIATLTAGFWSLTNAITSIKIIGNGGGGTFQQYSTATLYGIKNS